MKLYSSSVVISTAFLFWNHKASAACMASVTNPGSISMAKLVRNASSSLTMDRNLQESALCENFVPLLESTFVSVFSIEFACDECSELGNNEYSIVCKSVGETCCDGVCGSVETTAGIMGPIDEIKILSETTCSKFTSGTSETSRCFQGNYCQNGQGICECALSIDDESCQGCSICNDESDASTGRILHTYNCQNIEGGDDIVAEQCVEALDFYKLVCNVTLPEQIGSAGNGGTESFAASNMVAQYLLSIMLCATVLLLAE